MGKLGNISAKDAVKAFRKAGWQPMVQVGSHPHLVNPGHRAHLSIPMHRELAVGTLRSLIRDAGMTANEFLALLSRETRSRPQRSQLGRVRSGRSLDASPASTAALSEPAPKIVTERQGCAGLSRVGGRRHRCRLRQLAGSTELHRDVRTPSLGTRPAALPYPIESGETGARIVNFEEPEISSQRVLRMAAAAMIFVFGTLAGCKVCTDLPLDNPWNTDISGYPVDSNSANYIAAIGAAKTLHADFGTVWNGAPNGIPYVEVPASQPRVPVSFYYPDESDPGPYPIPPDAPIEGGPNGTGDRHVLVVDRERCELWELYDAHPVNGGASWTAGSGAYFDLTSNALRPDYWTSADAAGLPIYPGLVRYKEVVEEGVIDHALRFTVSKTQKGFIHPATHYASSSTNANYAPMGLRVRMKSGYSCASLSSEVQVICTALKKYGMFVADNGSDWYVSGAPDSRWSDDNLHDLSFIPGSAFEVVATGPIVH